MMEQSETSEAKPGYGAPVTTPGGGEVRAGFALVPHVCRACHSRLACMTHEDGSRAFECTNCGLVAAGESAAVLCCCGMKIRRPQKGGQSGTVLVDAGIRCISNPVITPEFPSLFVAMESTASSPVG
jgi:hypothetical protein